MNDINTEKMPDETETMITEPYKLIPVIREMELITEKRPPPSLKGYSSKYDNGLIIHVNVPSSIRL